jgi:hypothetical protein
MRCHNVNNKDVILDFASVSLYPSNNLSCFSLS